MTTITIVPESIEKDGITYRAIAGATQSKGKTADEALDALTRQLSEAETGTLVISLRGRLKSLEEAKFNSLGR